jgi:hypothetical protein
VAILAGKSNSIQSPRRSASNRPLRVWKPRLMGRRQVTVFPQHVGAGQGRMAAQVYLHRGGEPAQVVAVVVRRQEGGFREIHLARHIAHPLLGGWRREHANGGGIAGEGAGGEGIDLDDSNGHETSVDRAGGRAMPRPYNDAV